MEQYSSARVSAPAPVQVCGREYDNLAHSCNALRRASARPLPRHERLQNRGINAFQRCMYTLDCIRNKPSALSHSDVHLLTHDVQLPAMMCNYTFYTYKINALINMIITYLYSPNGARPPPVYSPHGCASAASSDVHRGVPSEDLFPLAEVVSPNYFMCRPRTLKSTQGLE